MTNRTLFLAASAPLLLAACTSGRTDEGPPRGLAVRTAAVVARDLADEIVLTGTLKPRAQVQVVAEVQARLLRVLKDEGARVGKDETLAVLDDTDYRLAHDRARAALAVAEANRAHAQAEKERADSLLKTGGITDRDHLSAQVAQQVAEAGLAQAKAEVAIAGQQLARTVVKAPFAGRVARRLPDPGAMLGPGTPVFTLVDDSVLEFRAPVASKNLAKVRVGEPVSLAIDALGGARVDGRIARTEPLVDERSRSFQVVVQVPGRADLVGGLFARASVSVGQVAGAIVVPPAALVRDGTDPARADVFVVRSGKAEKASVALGVEAADGVQVTKGLAPGDQVVLDPPTALASGAPVEVRNERAGATSPAASGAAAR
ncbi:MAG TPA: efflux RND transporter periplasmic adaptor subunit [Vicinamibacteria bacterium]|nr:efflux RND transporter periplasmic adaptor subunit [Vicinamibacteria bacterium]